MRAYRVGSDGVTADDVDYRSFVADVDAVFVVPDLEKHPRIPVDAVLAAAQARALRPPVLSGWRTEWRTGWLQASDHGVCV